MCIAIKFGWKNRLVHEEKQQLTSSREKVAVVMSVHWYVEYIGVTVEGLLRWVTVMHVPVKNEDLLQFQSFFQQFASNGDRVEETKAPVVTMIINI